MKAILTDLAEHRTLNRVKARKTLIELASGGFNLSQISAFLTVYMLRAITLEELRGFRDAMLELAVPIHFDEPVIDVCGTGGDGKDTFNISTLTAFVVAGAGQAVAKHGNYGVSSVSGSSNILEYFGYRFTNSVDVLRKSLDRANIAFLHAPLFHPAMKMVGPVRRELGVKTFFNMLGPMVNPARPTHQFVGVYNLELARQYAYLYQGSEMNFAIVHDLGGYDEVSLTEGFKLFTNEGERICLPEEMGFERVLSSSLLGGNSIEANALLFRQILEGRGTQEQQDVVVANAALAIQCADQCSSLELAVSRARESILSGKAKQSFMNLMQS